MFKKSTVTVTVGTPKGSGATVPGPGVYTYNWGDEFQIKATPAEGWMFDHWIVNGVNYTSNPLTMTLTEGSTPEPEPEPTPEPSEPTPTWVTDGNSFAGMHTDHDLPVIEGSEFVYRIHSGEETAVTLFTDDERFGYGTYEIRFKTNGYRPNLDHYCPLWLMGKDCSPDHTIWREIGFPEMYGRAYAGGVTNTKQIALTCNYNPYSNKTGTGWYNSQTNFEDGNWHTMKIIWSPNPQRIRQYIDGVLDKDWYPKESATPPPKMMLAIGYLVNRDWTVVTPDQPFIMGRWTSPDNGGPLNGPNPFELRIDWIKYWDGAYLVP